MHDGSTTSEGTAATAVVDPVLAQVEELMTSLVSAPEAVLGVLQDP